MFKLREIADTVVGVGGGVVAAKRIPTVKSPTLIYLLDIIFLWAIPYRKLTGWNLEILWWGISS